MEQRNLENVLEQSFLDYSAFVLQRRALPDARDGMKYTARQIIHAQLREGLTYKKGHKKSQKSVSAATAFSYVHGDTSCYEQIIRMGRKYVQRYFLEDIVGNAGQPNASGSYAAARYTEAALSPLACLVMEYLESDTLNDSDWSPTYDETGRFPTVFPSVGFYGLCNGSFGSIGVGLISSIPQFNLNEMNEVIIKLIDDPKAEFELYPDFASGGILLNPKTTLDSMNKGEGKSALIRSHINKYPKEGFLEVVDLPYGVYTNTVCGELGEALNKGTTLFTDFKDLTQRGVQIRIYSKDLDSLEQWLYKNTSIQKHFTIKFIMLDKGKVPKLFTLREAILAHINHASLMLRRKYEFDLRKLQERAHILEGFVHAFSILDEIIKLIRESDGRADAINKLINKEFSKAQAEAVVDLRLHRLSHLDIQKIEEELKRNLEEQESINTILTNKDVFNNTLKGRYEYVAEQWGDKRRTEIDNSGILDIGISETPVKDFYVQLKNDSYIAFYEEDEAPEEDYNTMHLELNKDYIIISSNLRGFEINSTSFKMDKHNWKEIISLKKDEHFVMICDKAQLKNKEQYFIVEHDGKKYNLHSSFVLRASTRGKKLTSKSFNNITILSVENKPGAYSNIC